MDILFLPNNKIFLYGMNDYEILYDSRNQYGKNIKSYLNFQVNNDEEVITCQNVESVGHN